MKRKHFADFRLLMPVAMILSLFLSCSQENLEELEQDHLELKAVNAVFTDGSCSSCIVIGSEDYFVESGWTTANGDLT